MQDSKSHILTHILHWSNFFGDFVDLLLMSFSMLYSKHCICVQYLLLAIIMCAGSVLLDLGQTDSAHPIWCLSCQQYDDDSDSFSLNHFCLLDISPLCQALYLLDYPQPPWIHGNWSKWICYKFPIIFVPPPNFLTPMIWSRVHFHTFTRSRPPPVSDDGRCR